MSNRHQHFFSTCLIAALLATPAAAQSGREGIHPVPGNAADARPGTIIPGRYIVVLKDDGTDARTAANELGRAHGLALGVIYSSALRGFSATVPERALAGLRRDPRIDFIEADQTVTVFGQTKPTGIRRILWPSNPNLTTGAAVDVGVAVIDTGIASHPDLPVPVRRTDCSGSSGICKDGTANDGNGHGTHVAGTIAALDNGIGVVGVAPGARLWAVKVLKDDGTGYMSGVIAGVDWATRHASAIQVANMSLGGGNSTALCNAIRNSVNAGVTYVVAAGNSHANARNYSPANCPDAVTVSALADFDGQPGGFGPPTCRVDQDDTLADFSNFGATIELTAPGVCIRSTWINGGYATLSGTSMASPHVAGAAALLASQKRYSPAQIRDLLSSFGNYHWTDDSGDGVKEPLLDVHNSTIFAPKTVPIGTM
jgi:subtilisin family serine protease